MNIWTEHRNPEGRTYWFNTGTRQSVWEKPDDLKTPFERALNQTKWKEYFSGGRKYYYNTETKESKWDMPDELLLLLEKVEQDGTAAVAPAGANRAITAPGFTPVGGATQGALTTMGGANSSSSTPAQSNGTNLAVGAHTGPLPFAASSVLPARPNLPDDPVIPHNGFATVEEGEKAFIHLLKKAGVDANWTWDQTMRAIITDPLYKALNTLAEKKACWEKYTNSLKAKEQEEKEQRLAKLRPAIRNMLKGNPNVFHYTTFRTADKLFSQHPIWQQARIEAERKLIFEEYVAELKNREMQESRAARSRSVSKVVALFKQLDVDVTTRWRQAHAMILDTEEWKADPELRKLPTLDILLAFEDYSRVREREYEEQTRRAQVEKTRRERKAREAFKTILQDLVAAGHIKARTKWKEVYPLFRDDDRYLNMLGNPGSNPLELFWDAVDTLDQKLDAKIAVIDKAIERHNARLSAEADNGKDKDDDQKMADVNEKPAGFSVTSETTEAEFMAVIEAETDDAVQTLSPEDMKLIYKTLHDVALKKQADEKRRAERKRRHLQDDLRYALKKLPEPFDISLPYEEVVPLIEHLPEYKAVDEEGRRAAFDKFVKRQKERMREVASEDGGSTTSRKRKEPSRDHRDGDREREREKERDRDRERDKERERDRDRDPLRDRDRDRERERDRGKDYDRGARGSRHHHRYEDYDIHGRRPSRDYGRDKELDREKDREGYRSSKHHRDDDRRRDREGRERERRSSRAGDYGYARDWEDAPPKKEDRERSASVYHDEPPREKRDYDERSVDERAEKRPRYDQEESAEPMEVDKRAASARAETPEEGEI
ncbi:hypothetical protein BDQ17DRAFT_1352580 [Cyathus striatus]|nr:hypothetical protein BDQ17DRAFT_1352580 [Cyathus striatus]